ncbi:MAG: hydrogenase maturation protease [Pseudomonadota bacterium]
MSGHTCKSNQIHKPLIVGYGNILRGDDGVGPYVMDLLRDHVGNRAKLVTLPQLDISLALDIKESDLTIFVDAQTGIFDDLVHIERLYPASLSCPSFSYTSHLVSIPFLLELTQRWYNATPVCYLVTVKGVDFSLSEKISMTAKEAARLAVQKILELL